MPEQSRSPEHRIVEVKDSSGITDAGDIVGAATWSAGDDLQVWFRDLGESLRIVTRSSHRVLIHVDVNRNGVPDSAADRVYGFDGGNAQCQFSHPLWATAAWGEVNTFAKVRHGGANAFQEILWQLPKEELGNGQDGAEFTFEVFDEQYQTREFHPGPPFETTIRFPYSKKSSGGGGDHGVEKAGPGQVRPPIHGGQKPDRPTPAPRPPVITFFRPEPDSIERGSSAKLRWSVSGASNLRVDPKIGEQPLQGEAPVSPEQTTLYTLIAEGAGGTASAQVTVTVTAVPAPVIESFQGPLGSIVPGTPAILRWSVSGRATNIRIEPGLNNLPAQGEREITPDRTTQYTLIVEGPGGRAASQYNVKVASIRPSIAFAAIPPSVPMGQSTTLRWNTLDASSVIIEPGIGATSTAGAAIVKPFVSTRYKLTAEGPGGVFTRDILVTVTRPLNVSGQLIWSGTVHGVQLVTIDKNRSDVGTLQGELPGFPVIILPTEEKRVAIASTPSAQNRYERLVFRVSGNGTARVVIRWTLQ